MKVWALVPQFSDVLGEATEGGHEKLIDFPWGSHKMCRKSKCFCLEIKRNKQAAKRFFIIKGRWGSYVSVLSI